MGTCRAVCAIIFCTLETILISGMIFGWDFVLPLFQKDSIFINKNYCPSGTSKGVAYNAPVAVPNSNSTSATSNSAYLQFYGVEYFCQREAEEYDLVYMLSLFMPYVLILVIGVLYDYLGTRIIRIVAIILFIAGCMLISYTTSDTDVLLFIGMPFISAGGGLILLTNLQICNWFFPQRSMVISWFIGCFCSSCGMFLLINTLECSFTEITTRYLFWGLAVLAIIPIITTLAILPLHHITEGQGSLEQFGSSDTHIRMNSKKIYRQSRLEGLTMDPDDSGDLDERRSSAAVSIVIDKDTYCKVSCNATYIIHVFWFAVMQLQYWWMYSRSREEIYGIDEKKNPTAVFLTYRYELFHYAPIAMIPVPLIFVGVIMDARRYAIGKSYPDSETIHVRAALIPVILVTIIAVTLACFVFAPWPEVKYALDALIILHKPLVLATSACFIFQVFPEEFFGRLVGVAMMVGGVFGVNYYTLDILHETVVSKESIHWINVGIAILVGFSIAHPIHLIARGKQLERETERRTMNVIWATDNVTYQTMESMKNNGSKNNWKSTEL
ncbi:equilibrative nucleobase transporter 1-like [Tubulanus polymorphus]|uniref:equilibrative nucleobase transporter 1-like n=1 Tax=Tubulanus polymorphus TaxID=672921 RepID=UPI003DA25249